MSVITNADGKIWLALKSRIVQWTECPVMLPDSNYAPSADDTFVIVQHVTTDSSLPSPIQTSCGVPFQGVLNISVMQPANLGFDSHIGLAGRVADFFPNSERYSYSGMSVRINGRARVIGNPVLQAPWNRLEVQIPWVSWG